MAKLLRGSSSYLRKHVSCCTLGARTVVGRAGGGVKMKKEFWVNRAVYQTPEAAIHHNDWYPSLEALVSRAWPSAYTVLKVIVEEIPIGEETENK